MPGEDTNVGINPSAQQGQTTGGSQGDNFILDFGDGEEQAVIPTSSDEDSIINAVSDNEVKDESFKDFDIYMGEDSSLEEVKEEVEEPVEMEEKLVEEEPVEEASEEQLVYDGNAPMEKDGLNSSALSDLSREGIADVKEDDNQFSKDKLMNEIALLDNNSVSSSQNMLEQLGEETSLSDKLKDEPNLTESNQDILEGSKDDNLSKEENTNYEQSAQDYETNEGISVLDKNDSEVLSSNEEIMGNVLETQNDEQSVSDQGFVLDYETEQGKESENETLNANITEVQDGTDLQKNSELIDDASVINNESSDNAEESSVSSQEVEVQSTLSLDQILDSELLSGQQFLDNSVAVPVNKPETTGNKKIAVILTGIGLFALAGVVFALAFPSGNNEREDYQVVEENQQELNHGTSEPVRPDTTDSSTESGNDQGETTGDPEEFVDTQESTDKDNENVANNSEGQEYTYDTDDGNSSNNYNPATSSVVFPDVGEEDQYDLDPSTLEPTVYTGYTENWMEETKEDDKAPTVSIKEATDLISSFKSQAEVYYTYGQENQDRYLIKYAAKITYLCEIYNEELKDSENVDVERLEGFKAEVNGLIAKIESHNNGGEEKPLLVQPTSDESSNFEGKDEIKNYLYSKS